MVPVGESSESILYSPLQIQGDHLGGAKDLDPVLEERFLEDAPGFRVTGTTT